MNIKEALAPTGAAKMRGIRSMYAVLKKDTGVLYWIQIASNKAFRPVNEAQAHSDDWSQGGVRINTSRIIWDTAEAPLVKCPCCGSNDTSGSRTARISVICWDCKALFKVVPGGAVQVDECTCSRHDNGQIIKHEEVADSGNM